MIGLVSTIRFGFAPLGIPNTGLGSSENKTQGGLPPGGVRFGFRPRGSPSVGGGVPFFQSGLPPNALRFGFKPRGTAGGGGGAGAARNFPFIANVGTLMGR